MLFLVPFTSAAEGDFKVPEVTKDIVIRDDGSCLITEEIVYDIEGQVNGTYRDIPIDTNQSITDLSVETPGYYNKLQVLDLEGNDITNQRTFTDDIRIKVWLYKDEGYTQKINNEKVPVKFRYTFNKGLKIYNDIADFDYVSWDKNWNNGVGTIKSVIKIPGSSSEVEYWNNPEKYVKSSTWNNDNELVTLAKDIPINTTFKQRILLPTSYFKNPRNAKVINESMKDSIEAKRAEINDKDNFLNFRDGLIVPILGLIAAIGGGIYAIFGREPKIDYDAEYEYDLPMDLKPMDVHAFFNDEFGSVSSDALATVILDLIYGKYYTILHEDSNDTLLKRSDKSLEGLEEYEVDVINYLDKFSDSEGKLSLNELQYEETPKDYKKFIRDWEAKIEKSIPQSTKERYFNGKGSKIFRYFFFIVFVGSIITLLSSFIWHDFIGGTWALVSFGLAIASFILMVIPNTIAGRWTPEGKEAHDKWMNFKKYISDFSLINERPPESVKIWGKYLVYASALGCADEATSTMKKYYDLVEISDSIDSSDVLSFAYYGGFDNMESSFYSLGVSGSDSAGGSDGSGGGFGGGGGGTF